MAKRRKWSKKARKLVKAYKSYKKKLEARVSRIVAKGQTPIGGEALGYNEFKSLYESAVEEQKEKTFSTLTREVIAKQAEDIRWNKRYNSYLKRFYQRRDKMLEEGLTPYNGVPEKFRDFKELYSEYKNDRQKEVEKGKRTSIGNINDIIISDQLYELSEEQAYAIFDYMKTLSPEEREQLDFSYKNINRAIAKIREGSFVKEDLGLWDIIKEERERLFAQGLTKTEVRKKISQTFFGSP